MMSSDLSNPRHGNLAHIRNRMRSGRTPGYVDCIGSGHTGVEGAKHIIGVMSGRPYVSHLMVGHNCLGEEGCEILFESLRSETQRHHKISELHLNCTDMGDRGLSALSKYLKGNTTLTHLFLQGNHFTSDPETAAEFVDALNNSHLYSLSLSSNKGLTDRFFSPFLSSLSPPCLSSLFISAVGITTASAPALTDYITTSRSRPLREITINGNEFTRDCLQSLIRAVEKHNFSLTRCELFANFPESPTPQETAEWKEVSALLSRILLRNILYTRDTERDAVRLLRHARPVLLSRPVPGVPAGEPATTPHLPLEIQLYTLSLLAPALSSAQLARIYNYAADPNTLPPDPRQLRTLSRAVPSVRSLVDHNGAIPPHASIGGAHGDLHWEQRNSWLQEVGCNVFEPDGSNV